MTVSLSPRTWCNCPCISDWTIQLSIIENAAQNIRCSEAKESCLCSEYNSLRQGGTLALWYFKYVSMANQFTTQQNNKSCFAICFGSDSADLMHVYSDVSVSNGQPTSKCCGDIGAVGPKGLLLYQAANRDCQTSPWGEGRRLCNGLPLWQLFCQGRLENLHIEPFSST